MPHRSRFLVFDIALNGYHFFYRKQLKSHARYAERIGAAYVNVSRPYFSLLGVECCWLKLCLLKAAIERGYEHVLFLDADAYVQPSCPDIRDVTAPNNAFYMAKGYTGRFNSGVVLAQQHKATLPFLNQLLASRFQAIPLRDSVGWGENGHIIHFAKNTDFIGTLAVEWNNTYDATCNDYIRHFNFGPMRQKAWQNWGHKVLSRTSQAMHKMMKVSLQDGYVNWQQSLLNKEANKIVAWYDGFTQMPASLR